MRKVLYYPNMNLPHQCESLSTSIIFSNQLNIIAPENAVIDDKFTNFLISEGVVKKIDPSLVLTDDEFEKIRKRLDRFIIDREKVKARARKYNADETTPFDDGVDIRGNKESWLIHREKLIHHDKMIHRDKMIHQNKFQPRQNPIREKKIHATKMVHGRKSRNILDMLVDRKLARHADRGFYEVDGEISSFLLGAISKELSNKQGLSLVASSFGIENSNNHKDIVSLFLQDISLDLLPTVIIREPLKEIDKLIKIRSEFRDDLDEYVRNLMIDINHYTRFALEQYFHAETEERRKALFDYIMTCKTEVVSKYTYEYREIERILEKTKSKSIRGRIVNAIPICLSIALAESNPYASSFLGALSGHSFFGKKVRPSLRLEKHKVIYNILKSDRF